MEKVKTFQIKFWMPIKQNHKLVKTQPKGKKVNNNLEQGIQKHKNQKNIAFAKNELQQMQQQTQPQHNKQSKTSKKIVEIERRLVPYTQKANALMPYHGPQQKDNTAKSEKIPNIKNDKNDPQI